MSILISLLPVIAFLAVLYSMDSFRLVHPLAVFVALGYGAAIALACLWLNQQLLEGFGVPTSIVTRYAAPAQEEAAKAGLLILLIMTGRIGFLVEGAVQGFAVGSGFALIENVTYLWAIPDGTLLLWIVRGFGTAVLQGGTTAIFAMIAKSAVDRRRKWPWLAFVPAWAAAVVLHSAFNHRLLPALAQTLVILVVLPLLMLWVFARSERATSDWIGAGLDLDVELLQLIASEHFEFTRFGQYLRELRARLPGPTVVDMFCLLRLDLELAIQAKALLLARKAGLDIPVDEDLDHMLAEREYLRNSIGRTGLLALRPLQVTSRRDDWHRHLLKQGRRAREVVPTSSRPQ